MQTFPLVGGISEVKTAAIVWIMVIIMVFLAIFVVIYQTTKRKSNSDMSSTSIKNR
jgi:cbb3-type cytochrome oxidase subunit 3